MAVRKYNVKDLRITFAGIELDPSGYADGDPVQLPSTPSMYPHRGPMPSDKSPKVSFNQWLTLQSGEFAPLRAVWTTTRGRLTRAAVLRRAVAVSVPETLAGRAYDAYLDATASVADPVPSA